MKTTLRTYKGWTFWTFFNNEGKIKRFYAINDNVQKEMKEVKHGNIRK